LVKISPATKSYKHQEICVVMQLASRLACGWPNDEKMDRKLKGHFIMKFSSQYICNSRLTLIILNHLIMEIQRITFWWISEKLLLIKT